MKSALLLSSAAAVLLCTGAYGAPAKVASYSVRSGETNLMLPDPMVSASGKRVTSAAQWQQERRPEILELFRTHVYGRTPIGRPENMKFTVVKKDPNAMGGAATLKEVKITFAGPGGEGAIDLVLFTPNKVKTAPCFVLICNRGETNINATRQIKSGFWPAEDLIARGYAAAAFLNKDLDPDFKDGFTNGVHGIFEPGKKRGPDAWATISAWAWGASRVLDYLETDPQVDARRVAVVGHSRGGKTALWAGAQDERFAMTVSNDSGCGGAALARRRAAKAETIAAITKTFPYWFCDNYRKYAGNEEALPLDQHMLGALIAPRLLYVASAQQDLWADPEGEFISAREAGRVYKLFGLPGLSGETFPAVSSPLHGGKVGYHVRPGPHNLTPDDWNYYMDFADKHLKSSTRPE